jgi:hypothetical protein
MVRAMLSATSHAAQPSGFAYIDGVDRSIELPKTSASTCLPTASATSRVIEIAAAPLSRRSPE